MKEHHDPIISLETFEKAQEILKRRNIHRCSHIDANGKRDKFSRKYSLSCILECGFCGGTLSRRNWHSKSEYQKVIWQCVAATKKGKKFCPDSKGISEKVIEDAFVESYRHLCKDHKDVLEEFLQRMEDTIGSSNVNKQLSKIDKDIHVIEQRRHKLVDMRLEDSIDKATYEEKYADILSKLEQLEDERQSLQIASDNEKDIKKRLMEFKKH